MTDGIAYDRVGSIHLEIGEIGGLDGWLREGGSQNDRGILERTAPIYGDGVRGRMRIYFAGRIGSENTEWPTGICGRGNDGSQRLESVDSCH